MSDEIINPMMTEEEIATVADLLLHVASVRGRHVDVLEWGSGGSTIYYPRFLLGQHVSCSWLSLEYNRVWYQRVLAAIGEHLRDVVSLRLFDVGNMHLRQRHCPMDEYVGYPATLGRTWDVILVDGRKRRRCLIEAAKLVSPGGYVVLHDAERTHYHCAFDHFEHGEFLGPRLWIGRQSAGRGAVSKSFSVTSVGRNRRSH